MDAAYSSVERTNVIYALRSLVKFGRTTPKVPPQKAQGRRAVVMYVFEWLPRGRIEAES